MTNQDTRDAGVEHVFSVLSGYGWRYEVVKHGRAELHLVKRNDASNVIQIRTLSKEAPVPFPQGLDILDHIDYLVICNNLQGQPNLLVLEPKVIRDIIHKDPKNELEYWLETKDYCEHGKSFEEIFG